MKTLSVSLTADKPLSVVSIYTEIMINRENKFVGCLCRGYIRSPKTLVKLSEKVAVTLYIAVYGLVVLRKLCYYLNSSFN